MNSILNNLDFEKKGWNWNLNYAGKKKNEKQTFLCSLLIIANKYSIVLGIIPRISDVNVWSGPSIVKVLPDPVWPLSF
mgnify:CR=1 FL=1